MQLCLVRNFLFYHDSDFFVLNNKHNLLPAFNHLLVTGAQTTSFSWYRNTGSFKVELPQTRLRHSHKIKSVTSSNYLK